LILGKLFEKFQDIIKIQKGKIKELGVGKFKHRVYAKKSGKIKHLDNKLINTLARFAGCPEDKAAGIYLYKKASTKLKKGDKILTIYSQSKDKLKSLRSILSTLIKTMPQNEVIKVLKEKKIIKYEYSEEKKDLVLIERKK